LLIGIFKISIVTCTFSAIGVILSGAYSLWLYNRIVFGNLKINYTLIFDDITKREFYVLFPLIIFIFLMGICPTLFTGYFHTYAIQLCLWK
jgi:NADH:ubiquinone oxidoreductase subunit 4 (subunit M)